MPIVGLGHTGLWVRDLEKMRDFYERVIGLTVTDKDVRPPFRKSLNLEQPAEDVNAEAERLLSDGGPAYQPVTWTPGRDSAKAW